MDWSHYANETEAVTKPHYSKYWWMEDSDPDVEARRSQAMRHDETQGAIRYQIKYGGGIGWIM